MFRKVKQFKLREKAYPLKRQNQVSEIARETKQRYNNANLRRLLTQKKLRIG